MEFTVELSVGISPRSRVELPAPRSRLDESHARSLAGNRAAWLLLRPGTRGRGTWPKAHGASPARDARPRPAAGRTAWISNWGRPAASAGSCFPRPGRTREPEARLANPGVERSRSAR